MICSPSTWAILHSWDIEFREQCQLLVLPKKGQPRVTIQEFARLQSDNIARVKTIFSSEFCKSVLAIYEKEIESFEANEYYIKMFCDANAILLSNMMREIIYEALDQYKEFFERFNVKKVRQIKDIIQGERLNPLHYEF